MIGFENLVWLLVSGLTSAIILFAVDLKLKRIGRERILAISTLIGAIGFIFAPQCLCKNYVDMLIGAALYAALFAVTITLIVLLFLSLKKV